MILFFKILLRRSFITTTNKIIFSTINEIAHISRFIFNFTFMVFNLLLKSYWFISQPMRFQLENQPKPLDRIQFFSIRWPYIIKLTKIRDTGNFWIYKPESDWWIVPAILTQWITWTSLTRVQLCYSLIHDTRNRF